MEILPESQDIGVVGIDGKEYPIPKYEDILSRITPEKMEILEKKAKQGFTKLLLVPTAMSLDVLQDRYKRKLIKHSQEGKLLSTDGTPLELNQEEPLFVWEGYKGADIDGKLVYHPIRFDPDDHGGKTKPQLLEEANNSSDPSLNGGWDMLFVEETVDIPAQGEGITIGERKQLEANQTPNEYLKLTQEDPQYTEEQGLTPEAWITQAISYLHQTNQQIDDFDGNGKICYMFGSYFPASSIVPGGNWHRGYRGARLAGVGPGRRDSNFGARSAVKI